MIAVGTVACSSDNPSGPPTPPASATVIDFCAQSVPTFFAYKNNDSAWTLVMPDANGSFTFTAATKVAITFVRGSVVETYYTTSEELKAISGVECKAGGSKTLSGSFANLGAATPAGDPAYAIVTAGTARTSGSDGFTLSSVPDGTFDLFAVSYAYANQAIPPTKAIIRRNLLPSSGSTLPALDFASPEAVPIVTNQLSVTGSLASDFHNVFVEFTTSNGTRQDWNDVLADRGAPLIFHAIPTSLVSAGDLHKLWYFASAVDFRTSRGALLYFRQASNKDVAVGPPINQPVFTTTATSTRAIIRATLASQAEYGSAVRFHYVQTVSPSGNDRQWIVTATSGYFGNTPATWEIEMPDLSTVPGFPASSLFKGSSPASGATQAWGSLISLFIGRAPRDGDVVKYAGIASSNILPVSPQPPSPGSNAVYK